MQYRFTSTNSLNLRLIFSISVKSIPCLLIVLPTTISLSNYSSLNIIIHSVDTLKSHYMDQSMSLKYMIHYNHCCNVFNLTTGVYTGPNRYNIE